MAVPGCGVGWLGPAFLPGVCPAAVPRGARGAAGGGDADSLCDRWKVRGKSQGEKQ
ncbi:hypothetical protein QWI30_00535 [Citrobacter freundii]|nr:hypothetical protein [Citrobacter freundii]